MSAIASPSSSRSADRCRAATARSTMLIARQQLRSLDVHLPAGIGRTRHPIRRTLGNPERVLVRHRLALLVLAALVPLAGRTHAFAELLLDLGELGPDLG